VTGSAVFSAQDAVDWATPCILVSHETTPDDIAGMNAAVGILTAIGGATSHAAVVARGMDRTCVVGCTDLSKDANGVWFLNGKPILAGTRLTIDGDTGNIWVGTEVPVISGESDAHIQQFYELVSSQVTAKPLITSDEPVPNTECWYLAKEASEIPLVAHSIKGYLDIRDTHATWPEAFRDVMLTGMLTLPSQEVDKARVLIDLHKENELKCKIVCSNPIAVLKLKGAGIPVVPVVTAWESLLDVEDEAVIQMAEESPRATQVLELRKKAGMGLTSVGAGIHATSNLDKKFLSAQQKLRVALG